MGNIYPAKYLNVPRLPFHPAQSNFFIYLKYARSDLGVKASN